MPMSSQAAKRRRRANAAAKAFGEVLSVCLRAPGVSVSRVARDAHITRAYLHRLTGGRSQPTLAVFLAIAEVLPIAAPELVAMTLEHLKQLSGDEDKS
jgi:hypothetical protein